MNMPDRDGLEAAGWTIGLVLVWLALCLIAAIWRGLPLIVAVLLAYWLFG